MLDEPNDYMKTARAEVDKELHTWWGTMLQIMSSEGVHMINPEKACSELLSEIVSKTFDAKANALMKRYKSMYLDRGGKEASHSSLRETRKQEGVGKTTKRPAATAGPPM